MRPPRPITGPNASRLLWSAERAGGRRLLRRELDAVTALAGDYQVPWELSEVVRRTYHRALTRFGPAEGELLAVSLLEDEAGDKLRAAPS
jgi:hypothetical protein